MKRYINGHTKVELIMIVGQLAGITEQTINILNQIKILANSAHFWFMADDRVESAKATLLKWKYYIWLALNWGTHSQLEIDVEIHKNSAKAILRAIYEFSKEIEQGLGDIETLANVTMEQVYDCDYEVSDDAIDSMRTILRDGNDYGKYAEIFDDYSSKGKAIFQFLEMVSELRKSYLENSFFISLAAKRFDKNFSEDFDEEAKKMPLLKGDPS